MIIRANRRTDASPFKCQKDPLWESDWQIRVHVLSVITAWWNNSYEGLLYFKSSKMKQQDIIIFFLVTFSSSLGQEVKSNQSDSDMPKSSDDQEEVTSQKNNYTIINENDDPIKRSSDRSDTSVKKGYGWPSLIRETFEDSNFAEETTSEERSSSFFFPLAFGINPSIRRLIESTTATEFSLLNWDWLLPSSLKLFGKLLLKLLSNSFWSTVKCQ